MAHSIYPFIEKKSADFCSKVIALLEYKIVFEKHSEINYFKVVSLLLSMHTAFCQRNGQHLPDKLFVYQSFFLKTLLGNNLKQI